MAALQAFSESETRAMFKKINDIPLSEKHVVIGFICEIMQKRPLIMICNLVLLYYYEREEFGVVGDAIETNLDKRIITFSKDKPDSAYGTILVNQNTDYIAIWQIRVISTGWKESGNVWVKIASKEIVNDTFTIPILYNWQGNIFYAANMNGNKWQGECNDNGPVFSGVSGAWEGFDESDIVQIILNPKKRQLRIVCGDEFTCFREIQLQYGPFRLAVSGAFKGDSLEILKFEKTKIFE